MVGVDKIVKETEVNKMTFYNYFHSKERFIEICLIVQKNAPRPSGCTDRV
ncbi:bacterial regulatory s, tetR family protein [Acinetobacter sp. 1592897]|nr:bacterial regulatory s, tetR family protein [Acinetobacter sp. 1592897]